MPQLKNCLFHNKTAFEVRLCLFLENLLWILFYSLRVTDPDAQIRRIGYIRRDGEVSQ